MRNTVNDEWLFRCTNDAKGRQENYELNNSGDRWSLLTMYNQVLRSLTVHPQQINTTNKNIYTTTTVWCENQPKFPQSC